MKCVKILGLLAVAAASLMAFAGPASATTLTSGTGTVYTSTIKAEASSTPTLDGSFTTVTCKKSTVEGKVEKHGAGITVSGNISTLSFGECNFPVTVIKTGSLEVHPITEVKTETKIDHPECKSTECTGTLTSTGAEVTVATSVGSCIFTTSATSVGTVTPTNDTGGNAILDIGSSPIPRTGGNFLCGSSATWTGAYKVVTPSSLWIDG